MTFGLLAEDPVVVGHHEPEKIPTLARDALRIRGPRRWHTGRFDHDSLLVLIRRAAPARSAHWGLLVIRPPQRLHEIHAVRFGDEGEHVPAALGSFRSAGAKTFPELPLRVDHEGRFVILMERA